MNLNLCAGSRFFSTHQHFIPGGKKYSSTLSAWQLLCKYYSPDFEIETFDKFSYQKFIVQYNWISVNQIDVEAIRVKNIEFKT